MVTSTVLLSLLLVNILVAVTAGRQWLIIQAVVLDAAIVFVFLTPTTVYFSHMAIDSRFLLFSLFCMVAGSGALAIALRKKDIPGWRGRFIWHYAIVAGLCALLAYLTAFGDFDLIGF
ncbi:MAG: hypothetical protein BWX88_04733 [Planctomycetes bacterium ADurb.Bin126]|nr:MAG: hypothetical protein BWX88_04733 [Planctomycetes bacterium ADurb.Bin126]HOD79867.1 hypothetical protein [Phycisphaerae bacterium]HQL72876.1 hypothetical protein [Phycisphaerae bacterium]